MTLMTVRFNLMNRRNDMKNRRGIKSHPSTFVGAIYENSASDLTMEMVLTAKRNKCSSFAF